MEKTIWKTTIERLKNQVSDLIGQIGQADNLNTKFREDNSLLHKRINNLKKGIGELSRRFQDARMEIQTLKIHIKDRDNRIKKLMGRIVELTEEKEDL